MSRHQALGIHQDGLANGVIPTGEDKIHTIITDEASALKEINRILKQSQGKTLKDKNVNS